AAKSDSACLASGLIVDGGGTSRALRWTGVRATSCAVTDNSSLIVAVLSSCASRDGDWLASQVLGPRPNGPNLRRLARCRLRRVVGQRLYWVGPFQALLPRREPNRDPSDVGGCGSQDRTCA